MPFVDIKKVRTGTVSGTSVKLGGGCGTAARCPLVPPPVPVSAVPLWARLRAHGGRAGSAWTAATASVVTYLKVELVSSVLTWKVVNNCD